MMTTPMKTSKATTDSKGNQISLRIEETRDGGYFHLRASVCTQQYEQAASCWQPQGVDDDYSDGLLWSGLRVSCQGDDRSQLQANGAVYGFGVEYGDTWAKLDLRKVRRMYKTLDAIEKKMARLQEQRGYVTSYGEYLGRVAEALGCAGMCFQRDARSEQVTGERFTWLSVGDGVNRANHRVYLWQQEAVARGQQLQAEVAS